MDYMLSYLFYCKEVLRSGKKRKLLIFDNGARGRNRTGTVFPPRDFLTRYSFHCCDVHHICGLDFLFAMSVPSDLGRSRQVSTLSLSQS